MVEHSDRGDGLNGRDQTFFNRVGADRCGHIAAVGFVVDLAFANDNLADKVLHIHVRQFAFPDDDDFVIRGNRTAHTVDLFRVGVAHRLQKDMIPLAAIGRQIVF